MNSIHQINDENTSELESNLDVQRRTFPNGVDEIRSNRDRLDRKSNSRSKTRLSRISVGPDEEVTRVLTTENPQASRNFIVFSHREKQFIPSINNESMVVHFSLDGNLIPIDSDEAKIYLQRDELHASRLTPKIFLDDENSPVGEAMKSQEKTLPENDGSSTVNDDEDTKTLVSEMADLNEDSSPMAAEPIEKGRKILNRFNFCEQGIQTSAPSTKIVALLTESIVRKKFAGLVNQRIIYQEYLHDFEKHQRDKSQKKLNQQSNTKKTNLNIDRTKSEILVKDRQVKILKSIERVLNQNRQKELIYNFKHFEDKTDETREPMGSLFPLWKFNSSAPDRSVTALIWSPTFSNMLLIGYGSYDRSQRTPGTIALFTLNNNHPDKLIQTESTVLSIDCSKEKPYLICVGLMDGDVIVYDLTFPSGKAVYVNRSYTCKHLDCVWQVRWCGSSNEQQPRLCSAGADGKVIRWTCVRAELRPVLILELPNGTRPKRLDDGTLLTLTASAISLDFHRQRNDIFLVGTEDGKIYKSSINDPGIIEMNYDAHDFAIHSVQWSPFHTNVFGSCSLDGTVKIWHEKISTPLMRFDLCTSLQDFAWSPHTSTTFATVGSDGKIYVFDIHSSKLEPICEQNLMPNSSRKCTKIAFNSIHPILLVGDENGCSICLKLSPNLRKKAKIRKGFDMPVNFDPELDKLVQELARTVLDHSMKEFFNVPTNDADD